MPNLFAKTVFASAALSCLLCLPADAKYMKAMKVSPATNAFGGPVIEVESDGEKWTRIKQGSHVINVKVDIKAGSGWRIFTAYIGVPSADFGGTENATDAIRRLGGGEKVKSIKRTEPHTFHTNDLVLDRQAILNACNDGDHPATQERDPIFTDIGVGIKAFFQTRREAKGIHEAGDDSGRSETAFTRAPVTIRCMAGPSHIKAPPKPVSVDIRVKQKGKTCPKDTEVTAYIDYDKPITARFRVIHNGKEPKSAPITIKARKVSFAGKTWYRVERMERYKLDPGKHSFQIKVMGGGMSPNKSIKVDCPSFKPTSMWLTLNKSGKATCPKNVDAMVRINGNGPGSVLTKIKNQAGVVMAIESIKVVRDGDKYVGHLTKSFNMSAIDTMLIAEDVNDTAHNSGWQALKVACLEALSGTLEQRGFAANRCKGEAAFSIRTNGPGNVPYRLECTGGRGWTGKVQAHKTGPNTYIGVEVVGFEVTNNELVRCALRTRKPLPFKLLAGAKRTYECHTTTGASGSGDLVTETRPEDPLPLGKKLTGDFSFIDNGTTKCPRGRALVSFRNRVADNIHYSLDCTNGHFSGVAKTAPHPKGGYVAAATIDLDVQKTTQVNCALKTVAPEKKTLKLKGHLYRCVKVAGPVGPSDLAPETRPDAQAPHGPGVVIDAGPQLSCAKGVIKGGECLCPRTYKRVKAGKNAFRCVRKVVVDPVPGGKAVDATPDKGKSRRDAQAKRRRLEALKKQREARKRAAEALRKEKAKQKAAKLRRQREAAKKKAAALKRKREAAKKAAKARRKRKAAKKVQVAQ